MIAKLRSFSLPLLFLPLLTLQAGGPLSPALRREVAESMLRQPDRARFLLDELEAGRVAPGDLDAASQNR